MGKNKSAADTLLRQWHMLRVIPRHPRRITVREIQARLEAESFAVTARTVQRDLMELSNAFPLVSDEREKPYGWSWQARAPVFDLPNLSNHEALAFAMVEDYLRPLLPRALLDQLQPYFAVAHKRMASERGARGNASWLGKVGVVQPTQALIPPKVDARVQGAVTDALLDDRRLDASYRRKGEREPRRYSLNPLALIQRGPVTYLLATVSDYDDVLMFALHRFERVSIADGKARRPKGFELTSYLKAGWAHYGTGKTINLDALFSAAVAEHLQETPLSEDQRATGAEGRVRLRATVADTPQLRWWLLAFGNAVQVLGPATLRRWFAETTSAMAAGSEAPGSGAETISRKGDERAEVVHAAT
jgi:predicted DNA-binding transcriptional regulator YafY